MALESTPPVRNMPSGTSLIRRMRTVSSRRSRHSEIQEASVARLGLGIRNVPVLADLGLRRWGGEIEREVVAGHQLADAAEERAVVAGVAEGQVLGEQRVLELGRNRRVLRAAP